MGKYRIFVLKWPYRGNALKWFNLLYFALLLLVQNLISISTHFCCHIPSVEILYGYDRSLGTISVTLNMKLIMLILKK